MTKDPNWRTNPRIQACKEVCQRFDQQQAIIITVDKEGRVQGESYGVTGPLCAQAGRIMEKIFKTVFD